MENLIQTASEFGVLGMIVLASFWFINKLNTQDQDERKGTIQILLDMNKQTLDVIEKNTIAFTELKEMIKKS